MPKVSIKKQVVFVMFFVVMVTGLLGTNPRYSLQICFQLSLLSWKLYKSFRFVTAHWAQRLLDEFLTDILVKQHFKISEFLYLTRRVVKFVD